MSHHLFPESCADTFFRLTFAVVKVLFANPSFNLHGFLLTHDFIGGQVANLLV